MTAKGSAMLAWPLRAGLQLGPVQVGLFALYRTALASGLYRWLTPAGGRRTMPPGSFRPTLSSPQPGDVKTVLGLEGCAALIAEADEIVRGQARLFGAQPAALQLPPPPSLAHWSAVERGPLPEEDIKTLWEPARFGWVYPLGRAYGLTHDERYAICFWERWETFIVDNPPNRGLHWMSGQEVALRLIAWSFAAGAFANSGESTSLRMEGLAHSVAAHAARIPPTLLYARAQNNNHLLSEAAGLITAGVALPQHPRAKAWLKTGRQWFVCGLRRQIASDGAYAQHSANYTRLMLQLALWVYAIYPASLAACRPALDSAARWLLALCDPATGRVPNLGPNDGALIQPLSVCPFEDYRPVLQAAGRAFCGESFFAPGPWDEPALWLHLTEEPPAGAAKIQPCASPLTLQNAPQDAWAYLRAARFTSRPGHADQLHLDLWWRGYNLAQDAGTFRYNAPPPWDNRLSSAFVHNTITLHGEDQMTRAGKFLYLDWAQADCTSHDNSADGCWERITARHDGYRRRGVLHYRSVTTFEDGVWLVEDSLLPAAAQALKPLQGRLHWLLPDWPYKWQPGELQIKSPHGWVTLQIFSPSGHALQISLLRAGETLRGPAQAPVWMGWVSPTYGVKQPALALLADFEGSLPIQLTTEWSFPKV